MNISDKINQLKRNFDPYLILSINKNDSNEKIESQFKKLLLKTHPDRSGGHSELFNLVKEAYVAIYNERKTNMGINNYNDHNQLRNEHTRYLENQPQYENREMSSNSKFDSDRFNQIYNENRMYNLHDDGYGDWVSKENIDNQPKNVKSGNFNESFNQHNNRQLQK